MSETRACMNYEAECDRLSEELCKTQTKLRETVADMQRLENRIAYLDGQVEAYKFSIMKGWRITHE